MFPVHHCPQYEPYIFISTCTCTLLAGGSSFGYLRVKRGYFAPNLSFSPYSPGSQCQGIHHMPFSYFDLIVLNSLRESFWFSRFRSSITTSSFRLLFFVFYSCLYYDSCTFVFIQFSMCNAPLLSWAWEDSNPPTSRLTGVRSPTT